MARAAAATKATAKAVAAAEAAAAAAEPHRSPDRTTAAPRSGYVRGDADTRGVWGLAGPHAATSQRHAARVRSKLGEWRRIGASRRVLSWLREGVRVPWNERGPPRPFNHGVGSFSPAERAWLTAERDRCLATGGWQRATRRSHVSRAFVTYHKAKPRLVIDLRHVNLHTLSRTCRYESLTSLRRMIKRGDWMVAFDLTDAYHHVPFHEDYVHYFTFGIETLDGVEYFNTPVLNFGWTLSPAIFTEIMAAPTAYIRNPAVATRPRFGLRTALHSAHSGTRTLPWLDDFAHFMPSCLSYEQACDRRDAIAAIYDRLGLRRAPDKAQWNPSHVLEEHLGFCIDSSRGLFLLTSRRERALAHGAHALLRQAALKQGRVRTRELASFAGLGESSSLALPLGRFMLRALYDDLASRRGWGGSVSLSRQTREDLRWWTALRGSPHVGRAIWRPPESRELWCDASDLGWGGALAQRLRLAPAAGFWSPDELPWHITRKELVAVRLTVHHFLPQLAGRRVLLHEDNQAVVWILTNFVSRSSELMHELRKLWYLLDNYDIALRPVYIRSAENRIADAASRLACSRDYVISRARFESVQRAWGWCTVDAFASSATAQLPRYWTPAAGTGGEAIDAFAQDWRGERLWLHPPPSMIPATVQMLQSSGAEAHVCVPHWAGAAWFGMLRELASESVSFPPGTLRAIAGDAPKRLCSWPVTIFRIAAAATS